MTDDLWETRARFAQAEVERLRYEIAQYCEGGEVERLRAEVKQLTEYLAIARDRIRELTDGV